MTKPTLEFSARGVIFDAEGRVLLVKHRATTPWTLPGGHVEKEETFQDAFIREAKEELNLVIRLITDEEPSKEKNIIVLSRPISVRTLELVNDRGSGRRYEEYFLAEVISGTLKKQDAEIYDYVWKSLEEIEKIPKGEIFEGIREIILEAFVDDE